MSKTAFVLALVLLVIVCCTPAPAQRAPAADDVNLAHPATPASTRTDSASSAQADWKGVLPGKTTKTQVESLLGAPAKTMPGEEGASQYVYPPGAHLGFNRIVIGANGIVQTVGIGMFAESGQPRFSAWKAKYGAPKQLSAHSNRDYHSEQGIYQFPKEVGLWVVADESTDQVVGATYYDPASEPDIPVPQSAPQK
ncbi:MAG: hypothetical protein HY816_11420 [Candidatus Wallbacteria bacterium]|nr:hypothetical protein [Candidatus Wallbacteria bacterium]